MKVVLFAGAALVGVTAVFGAVRVSQEATPVVVAKSKEVIRQVTQAELVDQLRVENESLRKQHEVFAADANKRLADALSLKDEILRSLEDLTGRHAVVTAALAKRDQSVADLADKLRDAEQALARLVDEASQLRSALAAQ